MVLVDVFVPSVDRTYDFRLNESIPVSAVIDEIAEMVGQKEQTKVVGKTNELQLYEKQTKRLLAKNKTLDECGVIQGNTLILV